MDSKLENIIRRYLSTTFDGESENCRSIGGQLAGRFGLTFDQAIAMLYENDVQPTKPDAPIHQAKTKTLGARRNEKPETQQRAKQQRGALKPNDE